MLISCSKAIMDIGTEVSVPISVITEEFDEH